MNTEEIILDDDAFLVSETDAKGNIVYANTDFCTIAGYDKAELIGKPHNLVRHPDMPRAAFANLWETIQKGETWAGFVKNRAKSGKSYWVYATVSPIVTLEGTQGYISCRTKAMDEEIEKFEKLYGQMLQEER